MFFRPKITPWHCKPRHLIGLLLVAPLLSHVVLADQTEAPPVHFTILHTNDHHGHFWPNDQGEYGMPARKTLVDDLRADVQNKGGYSLLLSGGDINTGVPESDMLDAEPDFKGMTFLGYDAMALGNHEFDNPLSVLRQQQKWANFPLLSANIYDRTTGERLFQPYEIFTLGTLKVAVLGLTTEDTAKVGNPEFLGDVTFHTTISEAQKLVPELRKKADIVIALTHMGHYENGDYRINAPGDVSMARQVDGIDLIVGGHSQDPVCMAAENQRVAAYEPGDPCVPDTQNGTLIVQAHEWGKYVGRADFVYANGQLALEKYELIPVNMLRADENGDNNLVLAGPKIPPSEEMLALLEPFQTQADKALYQPFAQTTGLLQGQRDIVRSQRTNLGTLVATSQMIAAQADMALINSGGIRDSIEAGDITPKNILSVLPFSNTVCHVTLTGKELMAYIENALAMPASGSFPQYAGLEQREDGHWWVTGIEPRPIEASEHYRLAINSFISTGGDGYPPLYENTTFVNTGITDARALTDLLRQLQLVRSDRYEGAQ